MTNIHLYHVSLSLFLEWKMVQAEVVEKIKKNIFFDAFFRKSCHLWETVKKETL